MARSSSNGNIRIVLTEPRPGASDELQAQLAEHLGMERNGGNIDVVAVAHDGLEAAQMAAQLRPDVILLDEEMPGMTGYEAVSLISLAAPDVAAVLMVNENRAERGEVTTRALRAGARAVVTPDTRPETLAELLIELSELQMGRSRPEYELVTDPAKMPVTISITGAKGGIGKSFTSVNLAVSFARKHPGQTVLIDFYGQYGNVPLMLDLHPNYNIGELTSFAGELDSSIIETHLSTHQESGLRVLAGVPGSAGVGGRLPDEQEIPFLADLIGLLRREYRYVFFDVPPLIGKASDYVYSRSQFIVLVSALMDLSAVRDTATLYQQLTGSRIAPERIKLVVSRYARSNELSVEDLEQASGAKVALTVPDDPQAATSSINEGSLAVISRPNSPVARGIGELVGILENAMAAEQQRRQTV